FPTSTEGMAPMLAGSSRATKRNTITCELVAQGIAAPLKGAREPLELEKGAGMKAYAIDEFGQPGTVRDVPDPEPEEVQVRVRVTAAGINPFDAAVVNGFAKDYMEHRFPLVPGMDAAGTIDAVGPGVEGWATGDRVFGSVGKPFAGEGTLAEHVAMSTGTIAG